MNKANNARSQQTRNAIRESLLALLEAHPVLELDLVEETQKSRMQKPSGFLPITSSLKPHSLFWEVRSSREKRSSGICPD